MNQKDINTILYLASKANIKSNNPDIKELFTKIIEFAKELETNFGEYLEKLTDNKIRYCDYYNEGEIHGDKIIEYFQNNYISNEIEEQSITFALYVFLKNVKDIVENIEEFDNLDELYYILDNNQYFEDLSIIINYLKEILLERSETKDINGQILPFTNPQNKYKIYFTGFSYEDLATLEKSKAKSLINKLSGQLSQSDTVTLSEVIAHVKEKYDVSIFRVKVANDCRIAFLRRKNVTAILGITPKTGRDLDYTRYDILAQNIGKTYEEIDKFAEGKLEPDKEHYKVIEYLTDIQRKEKGL